VSVRLESRVSPREIFNWSCVRTERECGSFTLSLEMRLYIITMARFTIVCIVLLIAFHNSHGFSLNTQDPFLKQRNDLQFYSPAKECTLDNAKGNSHHITSRRDAITYSSFMVVASFLIGRRTSNAESGESIPTVQPENLVFIKGQVSLPPDYSLPPQDGDNIPALYVTCRPDRPDSVPDAILSGTRGKPPPILAARFENPTFPFDFELSLNELTIEGISNGTTKVDDPNTFWWRDDDLVVSARWDSDGVAATRSPDDLVGRGLFNKKSDLSSSPVRVTLTGRGAFGKFATGAKK
jgi:hypothetical protein